VCLLAVLVPGLGSAAATSTNGVFSNNRARIDASTAADGFVRVTFTASTTARLRVIVNAPNGTQYVYDLDNTGRTETFPLSEGDGRYTVGVFINTEGNRYANAFQTSFDVRLRNQFAPFLVPNQFVNFNDRSRAVELAAELTEGKTTDLARIAAIYEFVVTNITYDREKARTVQSGYLPNIDAILAAGKGICFDYAAVLTAMLRSQDIPARLVVGYAGDAYHAWINAFTAEEGWVTVIRFDGREWSLMDPTFDSTSRGSSGQMSNSLRQFIGDGTNYRVSFTY